MTFGGTPAQVISARGGEIIVIAPPGSGTETVTVTVGGVSSQATGCLTHAPARASSTQAAPGPPSTGSERPQGH